MLTSAYLKKQLEHWNNWNATLLSNSLSKAAHLDEFLGSQQAEIRELEKLRIAWSVESRIETAVGQLNHIHILAPEHVRIASVGHHPSPVHPVLDKREVPLLIVHQHPVEQRLHRHASRFARQQLQVHAQLRVGIQPSRQFITNLPDLICWSFDRILFLICIHI